MIRWRILALAVVASFLAYVLRINLSIASSAVSHEFGFSEVAFGTILSAFAWSYGLLQVPGGLFGERFGGRRAMTWLLVAWGALTVLTALVPAGGLAFAGFIALRVLLGAAQAPLFPITSGKLTVAWFAPKDWGLPNGLTSTGLTLGAAAAGPGLAWLVGAVGWRGAFLATAPLALVLAAIWWWDVRDDPAEHPGMTRAELSTITADRTPSSGPVDRREWFRSLKDRNVLGVTISYFCVNYIFYLFFNWFFYYLVEVRELPSQTGGNFTGLQWVVGAVTATLGGLLSDRLSRRMGPFAGPRATIVASLACVGPLLVAGALAPDPTVAVVLLSLSFGATQLPEGAFWSVAMRLGGRYATASTGLMNTGGNIVGGVGAVLVPVIAGWLGWTVAVSTGAIFAVIGILPWLWIRDRADQTM